MSSIFDYATFFLMLYVFGCTFHSHVGSRAEMKTYYESLFHTGWFVESILTQTLIVHIIRTNRIPFFQSIASPFLLLTTLLVMIAAAFCLISRSGVISASSLSGQLSGYGSQDSFFAIRC